MPPILHSAADAIELLMLLQIIWTGAFVFCLRVLFIFMPNMNHVAARMQYLGRIR